MRSMGMSRKAPFRADYAATLGRERAIEAFTRYLKKTEERQAATSYILGLIDQYGPVVEGYPSWHPFTSIAESNGFETNTTPQEFEGLDHTIYFRDAFVTAPYGGAEDVIRSAYNKKGGYIDAEEICEVPLYTYKTTPVLVKCVGIGKEKDNTICKRFALGRMLSNQLPAWNRVDCDCGESWETMRRYILGTPCGSRSSLFVNQETGQALREVWNLLNFHELFGPVFDR